MSWFNDIYGALTGNDMDNERALRNLREWPLDCRSYAYINYGALSAHEDDARRAVKTALAPFGIAVAPACPTPHEVTFNLNLTDAAAHTWPASFKLTVYTSSRISGTVVRATGGAAIPGATVAYTGPASGTATTGADGGYAFVAVNGGAYTLVAGAAGCLNSDPVTVTTPPERTGVDFALGNPAIDVTPAAVALSAVMLAISLAVLVLLRDRWFRSL
jgi:hypothetical protein